MADELDQFQKDLWDSVHEIQRASETDWNRNLQPQKQQSPRIAARASFCMVWHQEPTPGTTDYKSKQGASVYRVFPYGIGF